MQEAEMEKPVAVVEADPDDTKNPTICMPQPLEDKKPVNNPGDQMDELPCDAQQPTTGEVGNVNDHNGESMPQGLQETAEAPMEECKLDLQKGNKVGIIQDEHAVNQKTEENQQPPGGPGDSASINDKYEPNQPSGDLFYIDTVPTRDVSTPQVEEKRETAYREALEKSWLTETDVSVNKAGKQWSQNANMKRNRLSGAQKRKLKRFDYKVDDGFVQKRNTYQTRGAAPFRKPANPPSGEQVVHNRAPGFVPPAQSDGNSSRYNNYQETPNLNTNRGGNNDKLTEGPNAWQMQFPPPHQLQGGNIPPFAFGGGFPFQPPTMNNPVSEFVGFSGGVGGFFPFSAGNAFNNGSGFSGGSSFGAGSNLPPYLPFKNNLQVSQFHNLLNNQMQSRNRNFSPGPLPYTSNYYQPPNMGNIRETPPPYGAGGAKLPVKNPYNTSYSNDFLRQQANISNSKTSNNVPTPTNRDSFKPAGSFQQQVHDYGGTKGAPSNNKKSLNWSTPKPKPPKQNPPVNFPQKGPPQRKYDTARQFSANILNGANRKGFMNPEQAALLSAKLVELLDRECASSEPVPRFHHSGLINRVFRVQCVNKASLNWLIRTVNSLPDLWEDCNLSVTHQNLTDVTAFIPGPKEAPQDVLKRLERQNPGLQTRAWRVYHQVDKTPRGHLLVLGVDDASLQVLRAMTFRPFLGLNKIKVWLSDKTARTAKGKKRVN